MERKINKLEHSHVEVVVTADKESWDKAQKKAFDKAASKIEIKGFRKGKAPLNLVRERVNQAQVLDDAINSILPSMYQEILEQDKIRPYAQPKVEVSKVSPDELEVKFTIVTAPEVELGNYKGLKLGKEEAKVTDEEVEKEVNSLLDKNATLIVKDDKSEKGDTVILDFKGSVDGVEFEGGSAENYELVLGSNSFIPGFEDQLVGHKAGEHVDVNVTFPEQYTEELKGKAAVFACDIHEVKAKKLPELNDEFVKEQNIAGVENVEQLKAHLRSEKLKEAERVARGNFITKVLEEVAKNSKIDIPDEVIENQIQARREDFMNRMKQSGLSLEQYFQIVGQNEEQFTAQLRENALKELTNYLILEEVAKKENLDDVSDADVEFELAKLAEQYKMKLEDVKKAIEPQMGEFKNNIKMNKVDELLFKENN